jgi:acetoacetyl-CoA synthetase
MDRVERAHGLALADYDDLLRWSLDDISGFWRDVWDHFGVGRAPGPALGDARMPGTRWFPEARLNWAEHALRFDGRDPGEVMLIARSESRGKRNLVLGPRHAGAHRQHQEEHFHRTNPSTKSLKIKL